MNENINECFFSVKGVGIYTKKHFHLECVCVCGCVRVKSKRYIFIYGEV